MKPQGVTTQRKAIEQYFHVVLFVVQQCCQIKFESFSTWHTRDYKRRVSIPCSTCLFTLTTQTWYVSTARSDLPLGIEDRKIQDRYLTASTEWNTYHGARFGRLNAVARGRNKGAWSAKRNNRRQWIMVGFTCFIVFIRLDFIRCILTVKGHWHSKDTVVLLGT